MNYLTTKQVQAKIKKAQSEIEKGLSNQKLIGLNGGLNVLVRKSSITYQARIKVNGKYTSSVIGNYKEIKLSEAYNQAVLLADKAKNDELERAQIPFFSDYWKHYREVSDKALNLSDARIKNKNAFYNSILHVFDKYRLNEITPRLISDLTGNINTSQNNLNNALSALIACFTFAVNEGILEFNKIATVTKLPQFKQDKSTVKGYKWIDVTQLKEKLFQPLNDYPISYRVYILLVTLTASRGGEIRCLKWSNIDCDKSDKAPYGTITIKNEDTKTKRDLSHFDHVIPLTKQLANLLSNYRELTKDIESPYLFPAVRNLNAPVSASQMLLPKNISSVMTGHGLRKTANTFLCANRFDENFSVEDIDRILSHKTDTAIHRIYDKNDYIKELYRLLSFYNDYIEENCITKEFLELVR